MGPKPYRWQDDLIRTPRKATNKFIEMVQDGLIDPMTAVIMCAKWMSEDDIKAMCKANEIDLDLNEEDAPENWL